MDVKVCVYVWVPREDSRRHCEWEMEGIAMLHQRLNTQTIVHQWKDGQAKTMLKNITSPGNFSMMIKFMESK